jgi:hypothetical protein
MAGMPSTATNATVEAAFERVSAICLRFAGADVKLSHGAPAFHVKGKGFATFSRGGYGEPGPALWIKSTHDDQRRLVEQDPARYFVPPYVGVGGWVAVRLDPALGAVGPNDVDLAILVENGWAAVVPKSLAGDAPRAATKTTFKLPLTDPAAAGQALEKVRALASAFPDVVEETETRHSTFRVKRGSSAVAFVYFLDNHHGDEVIAVCVRTPREEMDALIEAQPTRFYSPQYLGHQGWLGIRLNPAKGKVDWKDMAARIARSYAITTTKTSSARKPVKKTARKKAARA